MITKEQVDMLNQHQNSGKYHPYTVVLTMGVKEINNLIGVS